MHRPLILCVVGTRPEAVKVAPVVRELLLHREGVETLLVSTGQHQEILHKSLEVFGLRPDEDLMLMQHGQGLAKLTSRALEALDTLIERRTPAMIVGQGDTTTAFVAALSAFYRHIPFAHVEAGLRTPTVLDPFPEEFNRRAAGLVATHHLAPTTWARDNLLREGKDPGTVFVTGNTGIDAVLLAAERGGGEWFPEHPGRVVLLTTHRRENWGDPQRRISEAARDLVNAFPDVLLVVPMHPNPVVRETLEAAFQGHERVRLIEPPEYARFVGLMRRAALILTDSGGVQEEAPAFGVPVLVLRETTERPEGVDAGTAKLLGTDRERIFQEGSRLLSDPSAYDGMAQAASPYGDGKAAQRVRYLLLNALGVESPKVEMWA